MISNQKQLFDYINSILEKEGFVKKKDTWYLVSEECICFFSIGKSAFGGFYEHAMGCFLKELNKTNKEFPEYYKAHLKYSLEFLVDKELVNRVFDLENNEFVTNNREFLIKEFLEVYVIPFLRDISSKQGIKEAINKYNDLIYWINGDLRKKLSLKIKNK